MFNPGIRLQWLTLLTLLSGWGISAKAQQLQNTLGTVSISSPTAASLGKFGDIPVSYHTGVPAVDIPIYTVKAGSISLPISLSYHASGLKVMEPAGWVGAGWSLNAGGVITRTVMGQPDESGTISGSETNGHFSHNGYNSYLYSGSVQDWNGFAEGRKDGEPDLFFFNFGGYSGKFYFRDDRTPILVPQQDIRIIPSYSGGRSIDYFTIVTPDGTQYVFGNSPGVTGATPIETTNCYSRKNGAVGSPPVSSWFLNKVVSADNQFAINLSYQAETYGYFTISMFPVNGTSTGSDALGYDLVKNIIQGVRLSQISFPNGTVTFNAGAVRTDLSDNVQSISDGVNTSATSLDAIQISDGGGFCKKFNFSYTYFSGDNTALPNDLVWGATINTDKQRLRLSSVQEVTCDGGIQVPPYTFTYYGDGGVVPRRLGFGIDHWGYYNGQTGNTGLIPTFTVNGNSIAGANRSAAWPAMLLGSLTRIDYPTGGYNTFDFESNTGMVSTTQIVPKQLAAFAFHVFGQGSIRDTLPFQTTGYNVNLHVSTNCNYGAWLTIYNASNQIVYNVHLSNTPNSPDDPPVEYDDPIPILSVPPTGTFTAIAYLDIDPANVSLIRGGVSILLNSSEESTTTQSTILGGIRIKSITNAAGSTSVPEIKNFTYSGALLYSQPTYAQRIRNDLIANVGYWNTTTGYGSNLIPNGCPSSGDYFKSPGSIRPMASFEGSIMGYLAVSVAQTGNGRSDYNYSTPSGGYGQLSNVVSHNNVEAACSSSIPNYPAAPLPYDPMRGQLASELHFNEAGVLLKDIYYNPVFDQSPVLSAPGFIVASTMINGGSQLLGTYYTLNTARKVSMQMVQHDYGANDDRVTNTTTTYYGSAFHNQPTRQVTVISTGDSIVKKTAYAMDFRLSSCDTISDCSATYNTSCTSCLSTYNSAITSCGGSSTCLTSAYAAYQQCLTNARTSYVSCRNTNYMGPTNSFSTCHTNAENNADALQKPILKMQDINMNAPIEVSDWKNANLRNASFVAYEAATSPAGFSYPGKMHQLNLQTVSTTFTPASVSGTTVVKDSRYLQEATFSYINGNPVQTTAHDGVPVSYVWDHLNTQPIAKVSNATVDQVAYTSFEADGSGGWTVGSGSKLSGGITGSKYYSLTGNITKSGLVSSNTYTVSYWTTGNNTPFTISGNLQGYPVKGKTIAINGMAWTYYRHRITGQSTISIGGSGNIDELRLYPSSAQMTSYTYQPLVGMTSQCDIGNRVTYYEYDGLQRLKRIRHQEQNIIKTYDYQYQAPSGCGNNCYIITMQTLSGTNTLGYPVGVFNVHGKLLDTASTSLRFVTLWNADTANARIGTLSVGGDPLNFNMTLNTGMSLPAGVTGCRYYKVDLASNKFDGVRNPNGAYVDFGDGTGMRLPGNATDVAPSLPANTTVSIIASGEYATNIPYYIHSYQTSTLKTVTFYHNDSAGTCHLDNATSPAVSMLALVNLRGNLPQNLAIFGSSCYQDGTVNTVAAISNWSSIHSVQYFNLVNGDQLHPNKNMSYAQDFMQFNPGLKKISTALSYYRTGYRDTTFRLSRLKSDWNTFFSELEFLQINEDHWNHEDLSGLRHLNFFRIEATTQNHQDDSNSPLIPLDSTVMDNILNQIAAGAGQSVTNGTIVLDAGGGTRSNSSYLAVQSLLLKGWTIIINGVTQINP